MIVVIQCASGKNPDAGHLRRTNGQEVMFVADPEIAPADESYAYARPDDVSDTGESWRAVLFTYNADPENNPLRLLPAWQLYNNKTYELLTAHCGLERLFILSAGWGLVRADFLIPAYDITFSANAPMYKRRRSRDCYDDSNMLPKSQEHIVFFGGKDYVNLFCTLSSDAQRSSDRLVQCERRSVCTRLRCAAFSYDHANQLALRMRQSVHQRQAAVGGQAPLSAAG